MRISLIFLLLFNYAKAEEGKLFYVVLYKKKAVVYKEPKENKDKVITTLDAGIYGHLLEKKGAWFKIKVGDGVGWSLASNFTESQEADVDSVSAAIYYEGEADRKASDPTMGWFYKKYGDGTWFEETQFNVVSFNEKEYEKLITGAQEGNESAYAALKLSLLKHLKTNPTDPKYSKLATKVLTKEFWIKMPLHDTELPKYLPEALTKDKQFLLDIAIRNTSVLQIASAELKNDREFLKSVLKKNGAVIKDLPSNFNDDKELVLIAIKANGIEADAIKYLSPRLRNDKAIALEVFEKPYTSPSYAFLSDQLKTDREIVMKVVQISARGYYIRQLFVHPMQNFLFEETVMNHLIVNSPLVEPNHYMAKNPAMFFKNNFPPEVYADPKFVMILARALKKNNIAGCPFWEPLQMNLRTDPKFMAQLNAVNPDCRELKKN